MGADYYWYKEHGICTDCHHREAIRGQILCPDCRDKKNLAKYIRYQKHKEEINEKNKICSERRRAKRKAEGLCVSCGKPLDTNKTRCKCCLIKNKTYSERSRIKKLWES